MPNQTILLIDYEPKSIEQLSRPLEDAGYVVQIARDGEAGVQAYDGVQPDLVLVEAMLPKKHGFDVCREIKSKPGGQDTPVLITTAVYRGRKYRREAVNKYGCDEYIEKPISEEDLLEVCNRFLADGDAPIADSDILDEPAEEQPQQEVTAVIDLERLSEGEIIEKLDALLDNIEESGEETPVEPQESLEAAEVPPEPDPAGEDDLPAAAPDSSEIGEALEAGFEALAVEAEPVEVAEAEAEEPDDVVQEPDPEETPDPLLEAVQETVEATVEDTVAEETATEAAEETVAVIEEEYAPASKRTSRMPVIAGITVAAVVVLAAGGYFIFFGSPASETPAAPGVESGIADGTPATTASAIDLVAGKQDLTSEPIVETATPEPTGSPEPAPVKETAPAVKETRTAAVAPEQTPNPEPKPEPVTEEEVTVAEPEPVAAETAAVTGEPPVESAETVPGPETAPEAAAAENDAPVETAAIEPAPEPEPVVEEPEVLAAEPEPVPARAGDLVEYDKVDREPVPVKQNAPTYHPLARQMGQEGTVVLRLLINHRGEVEEVEFVAGILGSKLNINAIRAAKKWKYEPAMKDGVPVKVWKTETIRFKL